MSVNELVARAQAMAAGGDVEWRQMREDIHDELDKKPTVDDRVTLLKLFTAIMDLVERNVEAADPSKLQDLRNAREADYRLMIVKEAMIGENVCADILLEVTDREVAAGRMTPDHTLRKLAEDATSAPHPTREELAAIAAEKDRSRGFFARIFKRS